MNGPRDELLGTLVLGRYRICMPLGRGGMGVVYLGRTEGAAGFSRPVVIKRIISALSGDPQSTALFVREARILSNLQHPGVVQVLDFGEEDDAYVMVLEYVHGYNLRQWLRVFASEGRPFPVESAIVILLRILDALHYAHTLTRADGTPLDIVHRDVSPENILIGLQGYVKLADFGIARMADEGSEYRTQDGMFKGKLPCMPPEIYHGEPASSCSDVYAAGVLLYHVLSGKNPFAGSEMSETVRKVLAYSPPPISRLRQDVPPGLDEVLAKALEKDPERRFQTAAEFASALSALRALPEEQSAARLLEDIRRDFSGLPRLLGVTALEQRDAAWREQPESPPDVLEADRGGVPTQLFDDSARVWDKDAKKFRPLKSDTNDSESEMAAASASEREPVAQREAPASGRANWWIGGFAIVAILASGAALFAVFSARARQAAPKQRFLLVERTGPSAATSASPAASTENADTPIASDGATPGAAAAKPQSKLATTEKTATSAKPAQSDPAALSRSFARQQSRIQYCFQTEAENVAGQPHITVRFSIDASGQVQSAELVPGSLGGTLLGRCILRVARGTHFGPQPRPLTFSIPIVARKR